MGLALVTLTDQALDDLASETDVMPEKAARFADNIHRTVTDAWIYWHLFSSDRDPGARFGPILEPALKALEISFARFLTAAREVGRSLAGLVNAAEAVSKESTGDAEVEARLQFLEKYAAALSIASPLAADSQPEPANAGHLTVLGLIDARVLDAVLYLANLPETAIPMFPAARRDRGRPVHLVTENRRVLMYGLLDAVNEAGGKITFHKSRETSGTRALCILAPFLPPRLIPKVQPFHTLARHFEKWKDLKKQVGPNIGRTE